MNKFSLEERLIIVAPVVIFLLVVALVSVVRAKGYNEGFKDATTSCIEAQSLGAR